ncbi:AAA family ATPase [Kutzneria sp. NPDC052558]|uniref:helix-turn-helix transcriptional regulator n=1 Tax=Kutzneria sp. NPDC052558 TaxID=3364121 RepID=UPI0037C58683
MTEDRGVVLRMSFLQRTEQLAVLGAAFADADRGRGRVVVVTGGLAGGKTALLQRYCDSARSEGTLVLTATGARAERRLRMGLIDQLFTTDAVPPAVLDRAGRLLLEDPPGREDAGAGDPDDWSWDSRRSDAHTVRALCDLLLDLATTQPVVIGVDDVHFADEASLEVLLYLCRRLDRTRILLVLTEWARPLSTQPLFDAELTRLPHEVVELPPLSVAGVAELAGRRMSTAAARRVRLLAGGNPLLVKALISDNEAVDGRLVAGPAYRQAVLNCLHRWEPRLLMVGRALAVLGEHATEELAARLTGLAPAAVTPIMEVLSDAGLLLDCRFRHPQGAAAVLDAMSPRERAAMHLRAAEILNWRGIPASVVGRHLIAGGVVPGPWAIAVLRDAGQQAMAGDDVGLCAAALDLALTACDGEPERTAITNALARALWRVSPARAGLKLAPLVRALEEGTLDAAHALMVVRHLLWQGVSYDPQITVDLVRAATQTETAHEVLSVVLGQQWLFGRRETHMFDTCVELLNSNGPSPWVEAALALGTLSYEGAAEQIIANATLILRSCRLGDFTVEIIVGALYALLYADQPEAAAHWCVTLLAEATERGATTWQALLAATYGEVLLRKGDLEQAVAVCEQALPMLAGPGWGAVICLPLTVLLTAYTALGRHELAEGLSRHVVPATADETLLGMRYLEARGHHHLATGQLLRALEDFDKCGTRIPAWNLDVPELLPWRTDAAQAHLRLGNRQLATGLANEELRLCRTARSRGRATRVLAACSELRRRPALLEAAVDALQESGDRLELARAMAELSRVYDALGDFSRARIVARSADQFAAAKETTAAGGDEAGAALSDAELRVARLAARGHTNREISRRLSITASTVEQHLTRVYRKLKVNSRANLPERLAGLATDPESTGELRAAN